MEWLTVTGIVAMSAVAVSVSSWTAWRYVSSGRVNEQRTSDGSAVTRQKAPVMFWAHVGLHTVLAAAFAWLAVHVIGYKLGFWEWSI